LQLAFSFKNEKFQEFFTEFSASSPCILSRSILQVLYQPSTPSVPAWLPVANISINVAKVILKNIV